MQCVYVGIDGDLCVKSINASILTSRFIAKLKVNKPN